MPNQGDMRMLNGIVHVIYETSATSTWTYWYLLCDRAWHFDGERGVRVGKWTYPTCMGCLC